MQHNTYLYHMSPGDLQAIKYVAQRQWFEKNQMVFEEGDQVDSFYMIEKGRFSIYFNKQGEPEQISVLGPGDFFGEMAIFNDARRLASVVALEDSELLAVDKDVFLGLLKTHPDMGNKINAVLSKRNEELLLKENLIDTTGIAGKHLHISIKGDPSLRESAFYRHRYESVVDKILPQLVNTLEELLLERCVYKVFIAFNSGEVRLNSICDPFVEEIHTADKMVDKPYIDRHFPEITYQEKEDLVRGMYGFVMNNEIYHRRPEHWKNVYQRSHEHWEPIPAAEISKVLRQLEKLRNIPDFYLRNISISMIHNVIRMQFNCDGTHIVSTEDYERFLEENLQKSM